MHSSILNFVIKRTILKERISLLDIKKQRYDSIKQDEDIIDFQVNKFNEIWGYSIANIPFYTEWQRLHNLPNKVNSIEDIKLFPALTKNYLYENQELILKGLKDYYLTSTGGTSGITLHFPTSRINADEAYVNAYLGRSWWEINPLDSILMFWGHSHLFGKGYRRIIKQAKRAVIDFFINTKRVSSYSLDAYNVDRFYKSIIKHKPDAIISYSSNVFKICKHMKSNNIKYENSDMKGIILTSESVTKTDVSLIEKYLDTNVINEYGMAETGAIAYSYKKTDNIRVFWDDFIVTNENENELFITTIGNPIFPLINYFSEDYALVKHKHKGSVLYIREVSGKIRDVLRVQMVDGTVKDISTIFFDHVLKYYPDIYSIHYKQNGNLIDIMLTSNIKLNVSNVHVYMCKEISKEFTGIDFNSLVISQIDKVEKTIAGKNKTLLSQ